MADEQSSKRTPAPIEQSSKRAPASLVSKIAVSAAVVAAAGVVAVAFTHFVDQKYKDGINVAGSARQRIQSDRAIWSARLRARGTTLVDAYRSLQEGTPKVRQFLLEAGIEDDAISVSAAETHEFYARNEDGITLREQIIGYELTQQVVVTSSDVALVGQVSRDITQLIEEGVDVDSEAPEYIYSELGEVKLQLVGEATRDARERASQVANNSGSDLGELVSARVGVVQVNAANETHVSWEGVYDRTSVEKDVMVVVRTMFTLD